MSANKTRKPGPKLRAGPAATKAEPRAISLSVDFETVYLTVAHAMHLEVEQPGGDALYFHKASMIRFGKALDILVSTDSHKRENACGELGVASILYWSLRASLDRTQRFTVVRENLRALRERLHSELTNLDKIEGMSQRSKSRVVRKDHEVGRGETDVAHERLFAEEWEIRTRPLLKNGVVRARLFELKARQFLTKSLRQLDSLLKPIEDLPIPSKRGQPRKYSKDFLLLRCLRLFEKYERHEGVTRWKESNRKRVNEPAYGGALVDFVRHVLAAVDPTVNLEAKYSLGKPIEETRRLLKREPQVDELVHQTSSDEELLRFANYCESIRAKTGK